MDDPDYRSKFEKFDNQLVLNKFEGKTIFETREEITAIWKDKLSKQAQGRVKIYRDHPGEKASILVDIDTCKILDEIFVRHNLTQ